MPPPGPLSCCTAYGRKAGQRLYSSCTAGQKPDRFRTTSRSRQQPDRLGRYGGAVSTDTSPAPGPAGDQTNTAAAAGKGRYSGADSHSNRDYKREHAAESVRRARKRGARL